MDNSLRERISILPEMMDLLNQQIKQEQLASSSYLAMAAWCDQNGFSNSAKLFYDQSKEEREHMMKLFGYITNNGGAAISPSVEPVNHSFLSLRDVFESALNMEIDVTKKIHTLMSTARKLEDYNTELCLQWFVHEQMEEEQFFRDIIQMIELMGDSPLQLIDDRIKRENH
ncbi:MAG: ferritin [Crocinitomicaceae bacterium]|nr:ferritin [Crocinitomicaceae bacterium]